MWPGDSQAGRLMRDIGMGRKDVALVKQKLVKHRSRENKGQRGRSKSST